MEDNLMDALFNYLTVFQVKILVFVFGLLILITAIVMYSQKELIQNHPGYLFCSLILVFGFFFLCGMGWINLITRNYHDPIFKKLVGIDPPVTQRKKDRNEWFILNKDKINQKNAYYLAEIDKSEKFIDQNIKLDPPKDLDETHHEMLIEIRAEYREFNTYLGYYRDKEIE